MLMFRENVPKCARRVVNLSLRRGVTVQLAFPCSPTHCLAVQTCLGAPTACLGWMVPSTPAAAHTVPPATLPPTALVEETTNAAPRPSLRTECPASSRSKPLASVPVSPFAVRFRPHVKDRNKRSRPAGDVPMPSTLRSRLSGVLVPPQLVGPWRASDAACNVFTLFMSTQCRRASFSLENRSGQRNCFSFLFLVSLSSPHALFLQLFSLFVRLNRQRPGQLRTLPLPSTFRP